MIRLVALAAVLVLGFAGGALACASHPAGHAEAGQQTESAKKPPRA